MSFIDIFRSSQVRAGLPSTGSRTLRGYLQRPQTREIAFQNAFSRIAGDQSLAIDIFCGNFSIADKVQTLKALISTREFRCLAGTYDDTESLPKPPQFFVALAKQPERVIATVADFWRQVVADNALPDTQASKMSVLTGKKLIAIVEFWYKPETPPERLSANAHRIVAYEVGSADHFFRLMFKSD